MTRLGTASALADLAQTLGSAQEAEARVRRALVILQRLVPYERCTVVNAATDGPPRLILEPPLPDPERRRLEAKAEAMLATLVDREPGALGPITPRVASHLAVPLVALDEITGVLLVERDGDGYREEDFQLLSVVASLLGAYLASLRRHLEERRVSQDLRDAIARRTHFLSMLSHELRNPLAPIGNALHVLDRVEPGSEHAQRARGIMSRQFDNLTRLVDDLLDATRLASGKVAVRLTRVDLAEIVKRTVDDHESLFVQSGVGLDLRIAGGPLWMEGDAVRLSQVVGNLLTNAAKFANPGGRTEVSVGREAPGTGVVRVRDDGVGIAPDVRGRLFEPFAQGADALNSGRGGLGLGLALAKGLVDLHGGTIAARDDDAVRGTELVVSFPLLPQHDPEQARGQEPGEDPLGAEHAPDERTIAP